MSDIPSGLLPFCTCPARALSNSSRTWLSKHLNPEMESLSSTKFLLQDWRGVAVFLLYTGLDIDNFARERSPTAELLRQWALQDTSTIGKLLEAIEAVERFDVLNDEQLEKNLERDCIKCQKSIEAQTNEASGADGQPIQKNEMTLLDELNDVTFDLVTLPDELNDVTFDLGLGPVMTAVPRQCQHFDEFVCYKHQDYKKFVRKKIMKDSNPRRNTKRKTFSIMPEKAIIRATQHSHTAR